MSVALLNRKSDVGKTTVTLDPIGGWTRQRSRIVVIDADRKGENKNCWLDWPEQRANQVLPGLIRAVGLAPGPPRRDALEIAGTDDHVVTGGPPRFAVRSRSARLATDVTLTPCQPSPSGEGEPVEIRTLLEKARIFRPGLRLRFILNRYGFRALIAPERAEALADRDPQAPFSCVGRRIAFVDAARSGQLLSEADKDSRAARADDRTRCEVVGGVP